MSIINKIEKHDKTKKIWRYMKFSRFLELINQKYIFLCRADLFEDSLEGSYPHNYQNKIREQYPDVPDELFEKMQIVNKKLREYHYVNCWCAKAKESESVAMWKLYASKDIAIQSTVERLEHSLLNHNEFLLYFFDVNYKDHTKESFDTRNALEAFRHKDPSYDYEDEIRIIRSLMYYSKPEEYLEDPLKLIQEKGIKVDINPNVLIEHIYFSPYADTEDIKMMKNVIEEFDAKFNTNFTERICNSNVNRSPVF